MHWNLRLVLALSATLLCGSCAHDPLRVEPVYFPSGSATLNDPGLETKASNVIIALRRDSSLKVLLLGHADGKGSSRVNELLATKRTEAVAEYLIQLGGIAADRVHILTSGAGNPVASNASSTGRSQNRRVEFIYFRARYGDVMMRMPSVRVSLRKGEIAHVDSPELEPLFDEIEATLAAAAAEEAKADEALQRFLRSMQMSTDTSATLAIQSLAAQSGVHVTAVMRGGKPHLAVRRGSNAAARRRVKALVQLIGTLDEAGARIKALAATCDTLSNRAVSIPMKSIAEAKANAVKLDTRALHKAVQHNLALLEAVAATGGRLTARLAAVTLAITTSFR